MNGETLVQLGPPPRLTGREVLRIALSMTATCAIGAAILGAVFLGTNRYQEAARLHSEQAAVTEMLGLNPSDKVMQIHQFIDESHKEVIYRVQPFDGTSTLELVFQLDGSFVRRSIVSEGKAVPETLKPLGRIFVANQDGVPVGFVTEGECSSYKNRIRFFVAIDPKFEVAGVRVIEHEEDPGLGAEVATTWFQGQYIGRPLSTLSGLDVAKDPVPEDWSVALNERKSMSLTAWRSRFVVLLTREQTKPIYAVTGATISSRALTNGVRIAAHHFERRWALLVPYLEGKK